ncbi:C39 family peptidase [Streptomyces viridochromogenes]|uniref:C39 family peptidase n=1 Tax=Streptomyces viridochromogenes TaxID=1938 RepID=UPI00065C6DFC|nr:C39 family peptidase [Streptomyces viridochromogenes]
MPLTVRRYAQHFTVEEQSDNGFAWPPGGPEAWGEKCCGLACLRMILDHYGLPVPSQRRLLGEGLEQGAYTPNGWIHRGMVEIAGAHGLSGAAAPFTSAAQLQSIAEAGIPSIVSCTFRFPEDGRKGGHLVVFCGEVVKAGRRYATFADPSRWGAQHTELPAERFWASWTGRGVPLWPRDWPSERIADEVGPEVAGLLGISPQPDAFPQTDPLAQPDAFHQFDNVSVRGVR